MSMIVRSKADNVNSNAKKFVCDSIFHIDKRFALCIMKVHGGMMYVVLQVVR